MAENIILIGFMGVGKGRTARALAAATGRYAIDTDNLIEIMVKKKIRKIFKKNGEPCFRALEQQTADWLEQHVTGTIVSTGGGFFMVNNINRLGTVVYLHSSVKGILTAMQNHPKAKRKIKKRPLLKDLDTARTLFNERLPKYRQVADYEINIKGREIADVVKEIAELVK
ncbi:MAG: shikimate kinase [Desulfobulbaceae bacterium]|nr:shikimate kinase [Desulfobulbaceae bacterium]